MIFSIVTSVSATEKKSSLWTNLLLLLVVLAVCIAAAEVILRIAWSGYTPGSGKAPIMAYDDTLGWIGKPNYEGPLTEGGLVVPCRMNDWGFRDEQPSPPGETPGKIRVMFLGDSYVMGTGVEEDDRVSEVLAQLDTGLVCFNFGIFGYSTDQELLVLKRFGTRVKPDVVLLFFCANDLIYNDSDLGHRVPKPHYRVAEDGSLILGNVPVPKAPEPNPVLEWLRERTALGQITYRVIQQLGYSGKAKNRRTTARVEKKGFVDERSNLDSLLLFQPSQGIGDLTYFLLREVRDTAEELGADLILVAVPSNRHWTETRKETPDQMRRVLDWSRELNISTLDLFPVFYEDYHTTGENLYLPDKMHWNARGNRIAAEALDKYLQEFPPVVH